MSRKDGIQMIQIGYPYNQTYEPAHSHTVNIRLLQHAPAKRDSLQFHHVPFLAALALTCHDGHQAPKVMATVVNMRT